VVSSATEVTGLWATGGAAAAGAIPVRVAALAEGVVKAMLLTKLRVGSVVLAVVVAVGAGGLFYRARAAEPPASGRDARPPAKEQVEDAAMKELRKLRGTWKLVSGEKQGKPPDEKELKHLKNGGGVQLVIDGDTITLKTMKPGDDTNPPKPLSEIKGKLTIDPGKKPKTMDWSLTRPEDGKPLNAAGIYKLEGDSLTFCYGVKRPAEFKTKPDPDLDERMYVFQRDVLLWDGDGPNE
jgi:uncharacterized protein (TIGR03067 family)